MALSKEERDMKKKFVSKWLRIALIATMVFGIFVGFVQIANAVGPNYEFQKAVHSHIENAYWASTPELMESQILLAMDGMRELQLTEDMYGKYLPWRQTPDWRMDYCYLHLQAIIERCHEVIDWREHQDLTSGQVTDIYNQKMDNLHNFLKEGGWSDEIAKGAFYVEHHSFLYFWWWVVGGLLFIVAGLCWGWALDAIAGEFDNDSHFFWRVMSVFWSVVVVVVLIWQLFWNLG